jgi:hypothetical protein
MIVTPAKRLDWCTWRDPDRAWCQTYADLPGLRPFEAAGRMVIDFHISHLPCMPVEVVAAVERLRPPQLLYGQIDTSALRSYQIADLDFLGPLRGALLCYEMRLGKTALACHLHDPGDGILVILAPLAAREAWRDWVERTFNVGLICLSGRKDIVEQPGYPAYFCHFDIAAAHAGFLQQQRIGTLVLDEIHMLQSAKAQRVSAASTLAPFAGKILGLTGTPMWNKPVSMYTLLHLLMPGAWGTPFQFKKRYCLPPTAPILMADFTERPLAEVHVGDKVVGWARADKPSRNGYGAVRGQRRLCEATVLDTFCREAPLVRVILDNKQELICTADHRWLTGYSGEKRCGIAGEFSVPRAGVVGGSGTWAASRIVHIVDGIQPPIDSAFYRDGYLIGAFRGDGWCTRLRKEHRNAFRHITKHTIAHHRVGLKVKDVEFVDRIAQYLQQAGLQFTRFSNAHGYFGVELNTLQGFKFFARQLSKLRGPRSLDLRAKRGALGRPWRGSRRTHLKRTQEWWRGFLAGIYDAEGCGEIISQYAKVNPVTYKLICQGLEVLGLEYTKGPFGVRIRGGREAMQRFWQLTSPALLRKVRACAFNKGGRFKGAVRYVTHVYPLPGLHKVYTLRTTTGNYVAYGYGSKNCDAQPGAHGWTYDGISNADELQARLERVMVRRTWASVMPELPPTTRVIETVGLTATQLAGIEAAAMRVSLAHGTTTVAGYNATLRRKLGEVKIKPAVEIAKRAAADGHKVVLWCWHNEVADKVATLAEASGVACWRLQSADSANRRDEAVAAFRACNYPAFLVANMGVGGVGLDLSCSDYAIFVELDWTPAVVQQAEMRTFHKDRPHCLVFLQSDCGIEAALIEALDVKNGFAAAVGLGADDVARRVLG